MAAAVDTIAESMATASTTPKRRTNKHGAVVREFLCRLEEPMYEQLEERAREDRMSKVEVIRHALRRYL